MTIVHTAPKKGRFAPSPSGRMHLGNLFTALMSWLSIRSQGGKWVLRIEDLDPQRSKYEYARQIEDDLQWLGLTWDEGGLTTKVLTDPTARAAAPAYTATPSAGCRTPDSPTPASAHVPTSSPHRHPTSPTVASYIPAHAVPLMSHHSTLPRKRHTDTLHAFLSPTWTSPSPTPFAALRE